MHLVYHSSSVSFVHKELVLPYLAYATLKYKKLFAKKVLINANKSVIKKCHFLLYINSLIFSFKISLFHNITSFARASSIADGVKKLFVETTTLSQL